VAHAAGNGLSLSNRILSLLPGAEYERLAPHFDYAELPARGGRLHRLPLGARAGYLFLGRR
jgi:hypothetical protein